MLECGEITMSFLSTNPVAFEDSLYIDTLNRPSSFVTDHSTPWNGEENDSITLIFDRFWYGFFGFASFWQRKLGIKYFATRYSSTISVHIHIIKV